MKIRPEIYAQALIAGAKEKADTKAIVKAFWLKLQKNNQYKDLGKILDALDQEFAKLSGKVLAEVYSEKKLAKEKLKLIEAKLKKQLGKEAIIKNIVSDNHGAGIVIKVDGTEFNLSLTEKINRLKNTLNNAL